MGGRRWVASLPSLARWRLWAAGPMHNGAALGGKKGGLVPKMERTRGEGEGVEWSGKGEERGSGAEWKKGGREGAKWKEGREG